MYTDEQKSWLTSFLGDGALTAPDNPAAGTGTGDDDTVPGEPAGLAGDASDGGQDGGQDGEPGGGLGADADQGAPPAAQAEPGSVGKGAGEVERFAPLPIIILGVKDLLGELTGTIFVHNATSQPLILDPSSVAPISGATYDSNKPLARIEPGKQDQFKLKTKNLLPDVPFLPNVSTFDVEGTLRYTVGEGDTVFACHYHNPRIPLITSNSADGTVTGTNAANFTVTKQTATPGNDSTFTFELSGGGTAPPTPLPGGGGVQLSCRVTVANQTQSVLYLRKQDKATGDYVTNAATSLKPGESTNFVFEATPNGTDKEIRGLMSWDVDDPKLATWDLMWDNPQGAKNYTAGLLTPKDGPFHSLDQIDDGDENVPVTFTLSGGGAHPNPPDAKPGTTTVVVTNNSAAPLKLSGQTSDAGAFQGTVPASVDPGKSVTIVQAAAADAPAKGCKGSLTWDVGDPKSASWTQHWAFVPGGKNTADAASDPGAAGFTSDAEIADGDNPTAKFALSGGAAPVQPDDAFAPPPKSKQPTLRVGDESPDGWIEYAQVRLANFGLGGTADGKFDKAMETRVHKFQQQQGLQDDGVIGNETWAALREAPHEAVGTDGRTPHTFEEKGAQGRFMTEKPDCTAYFPTQDQYRMTVISTGEQALDKFNATVEVIRPDKTSHTHHFPIGAAEVPINDGQASLHYVTIDKFSEVYGLKDPDPAKNVDPFSCTVDAYLDQAIGGDRFTGPVAP